MTAMIVFDDGCPRLSPLTDLRASFDVRTGAFTTFERLSLALTVPIAGLIVPEPLRAVTAERHTLPVNTLPSNLSGEVLIINGRAPASDELISTLEVGQSLVEKGTGELVAACVPAASVQAFYASRRLPELRATETEGRALMSKPWHFITFRDRCLATDLELLGTHPTLELPPGVVAIGEHPLTIHATALVYPGVTLDLENGPIAIADHATIRPGSVIIGPAAIGSHSTVLDRAIIKAHTAIGPWCKVAGEVGGTIMQGYSNKGHDGHLGDSWLGEWVNLGAGTTNSNLLNTYGEIIARQAPNSPNERTGEMFLGCMLGDHVKTAISTRIMTGTVVHTGAMIATTAAATGSIDRFAWCVDGGAKRYRFDKFMDAAKAMMARRKVIPSDAYAASIQALHGAGPANPV